MTVRELRAGVLDPVDRVSEIIFGLLMALSFTGSISAATTQREDIRVIMLAALTCNIAWGMVDAVMYLVAVAVERSRGMTPKTAGGRVLLHGQDFVGALGVFLLVTLATFPVVLPFFFISDTFTAMRVSNAIALATLFAAGYQLGAYAGFGPWRAGFVMAGLGAVLVAIIIAMGG
jgi:hypothetical protein